mgnify:CR=1 FL=1
MRGVIGHKSGEVTSDERDENPRCGVISCRRESVVKRNEEKNTSTQESKYGCITNEIDID